MGVCIIVSAYNDYSNTADAFLWEIGSITNHIAIIHLFIRIPSQLSVLPIQYPKASIVYPKPWWWEFRLLYIIGILIPRNLRIESHLAFPILSSFWFLCMPHQQSTSSQEESNVVEFSSSRNLPFSKRENISPSRYSHERRSGVCIGYLIFYMNSCRYFP